MRRNRSPLVLVVAVTAAVVLSSCGVTADTTAATVSGRDVSVDDVDTLARDAAFAAAVTGGVPAPDDESRLPGTTARSALTFELQRVAWLAELERWGVDLDDTTVDAARSELGAPQGADGQSLEFDDRTADMLAEYVAARTALAQRLAQLDPSDQDDLRNVYDGAEVLWDQVCMVAIGVPADQIDVAQDLIDDGADLEAVADELSAEIVADPSTGCLSVAQLPGELGDALEDLRPGRTSDVIVVGAETATRSGFVVRVEERRQVAFADATAELEQLVQQLQALAESELTPQQSQQQQNQSLDSWIQLQVLAAEVNPRYGSGVGTDATGQVAVLAPPVPQLPLGAAVAAATDQFLAGATGSTTQGG